jgi:hypothetical protein
MCMCASARDNTTHYDGDSPPPSTIYLHRLPTPHTSLSHLPPLTLPLSSSLDSINLMEDIWDGHIHHIYPHHHIHPFPLLYLQKRPPLMQPIPASNQRLNHSQLPNHQLHSRNSHQTRSFHPQNHSFQPETSPNNQILSI